MTFESVYKTEIKDMVRVATFIVGCKAVAEEVVHDAFLKLHENWSTVDNPGGFVRFAVVNGCKSIKRKQKISKKYLSLVKPEVELDQPIQYLVDALAELDFKRRSILVLRFYGDYKLAEIAEILDIPEGTVNSNLRRGMNELREALSNG